MKTLTACLIASAACALLQGQNPQSGCGAAPGGNAGVSAEYHDWDPNWDTRSCFDENRRGGLIYQRSSAHKPPKPALKAYERGIRALHQRRASEATAGFGEAVRLDPAFVDAHAQLGVVLARSGHLEDALSHFEQAVRLEPNSAILYADLAGDFVALDRPAEAEQAARRALRLDPRSRQANYLLAVAQVQQGRFTPDIARELEASAVIFPNARQVLAWAREHLGSAEGK